MKFKSYYLKKLLELIRKEWLALVYGLKNLTESNIEIGLYHLRKGNYSDAIFRFRLISRWFDPGNKQVNYWLGWAYLLKNQPEKAVLAFENAQGKNNKDLLKFVRDVGNCTNISDTVISTYRDLIAKNFQDNFVEQENLAKDLLTTLIDKINFLPERYSILEINPGLGHVGMELKYRMQESYDVTALEQSSVLLDLHNQLFADNKIYDAIEQTTLTDFVKKSSKKHEVILSLEGFSYDKNLQNVFANVFSLLSDKGYFAFAVQIADKTSLLLDKLKFVYNKDQIEEQLALSGFKVVYEKKFSLENKNIYSIFVCTK